MNLEGTRLGKYELHAEIGVGGMGVVYRGYDPTLDRPVAIKILASHLAREEKFVERFMREARAAARLRHPRIVTIYDVGEESGRYYFVMEYLEGRTLSQILHEQGQFSTDDILSILSQLADALDAAHAHGLVHRDVKPANVIVDDQGQVTLTDFGLVQAARETRLTTTGETIGTPEYMSPEHALGEKVGPPADLYSLAIIAYEMLSGAVPFDADSTPAILHKQVYEPPPSIAARRPDQINRRTTRSVRQKGGPYDGGGGQSGNVWKLRFSPDELGTWEWTTSSNDAGLNGQSGQFECVASGEPGPIVANGRSFEWADGVW